MDPNGPLGADDLPVLIRKEECSAEVCKILSHTDPCSNTSSTFHRACDSNYISTSLSLALHTDVMYTIIHSTQSDWRVKCDKVYEMLLSPGVSPEFSEQEKTSHVQHSTHLTFLTPSPVYHTCL
jgi:hypothetical protein